MTLKEYIENLNEFVKENPETVEMQVITGNDDGDNEFNLVHYTPVKGIYNAKDKDFISTYQYDEHGICSEVSANAVCVN